MNRLNHIFFSLFLLLSVSISLGQKTSWGHPFTSVFELKYVNNVQEFGQYMFGETEFEFWDNSNGRMKFMYNLFPDSTATTWVVGADSSDRFNIKISTCDKRFYDLVFDNVSDKCDFVTASKHKINYVCGEMLVYFRKYEDGCSGPQFVINISTEGH